MRWGDNSNDPGRRRIRFPRSVKNKLFAAQQGRCAYCGQSHHPRYLRIDHKYPFSRGGSDDFDNLQILCNPCNLRKGILSDEEFRHRYQRLLPTDGSIPSPPIPQAHFTEETRHTRAPKEVRAIFHERFSAYRERQRPSHTRRPAHRVSQRVSRTHQPASQANPLRGCSVLVGTMVLVLFALAFLALMD